jgi:hypothetical protein
MQDFILDNKGITSFCIDALIHKLILRFDTAVPMLKQFSVDIMLIINKSFLRAGDALKFLMIEHDEDNNIVMIVESKDLKEIIHFRYLRYFTYSKLYF